MAIARTSGAGRSRLLPRTVGHTAPAPPRGWLQSWLLMPAVVLAMAVLGWTALRDRLGQESIAPLAALSMLQAPTYSGLDSKGRPYTLAARRAWQAGGDLPAGTALVDLEAPAADIQLGPERWLALRASGGRYDQGRELLRLQGGVEVLQDDGVRLVTEELLIDLSAARAWSSQPVIISGDFGELRGQGLQASQQDQRYVLTGPAQAILQPAEN